MRRIFIITVLVALTLINVGIYAQADKNMTYSKYIAACLYSFSRYVNWPADKKSGDFVITVVGNKDVYNDLQQMIVGKMVGDQHIVVKYSRIASELNNNSQMIFLSENQSSGVQKLEANGTLVVSEQEGTVQKGASVDFVNVDDVVKFEISKTNMTRQGLQINSFLEKLSYRVI